MHSCNAAAAAIDGFGINSSGASISQVYHHHNNGNNNTLNIKCYSSAPRGNHVHNHELRVVLRADLRAPLQFGHHQMVCALVKMGGALPFNGLLVLIDAQGPSFISTSQFPDQHHQRHFPLPSSPSSPHHSFDILGHTDLHPSYLHHRLSSSTHHHAFTTHPSSCARSSSS